MRINVLDLDFVRDTSRQFLVQAPEGLTLAGSTQPLRDGDLFAVSNVKGVLALLARKGIIANDVDVEFTNYED
jgi:hypothetical protein